MITPMNRTLGILKALSDRNRLRVVAALMHYDELFAGQLVELLQVTGATASRHLSLLLNARVIESRKDGRWVYYRLASSLDSRLTQWLESEIKETDDLAADRSLLEEIVSISPEDLCRKQRGEVCCPK